MLPAGGCPGCGSRSISAQGICEYCNTRVALVAPQLAQAAEAPAEPAMSPLDVLIRMRLNRLRGELRFLEEQWAETAHPSLPLKISRVRQELAEIEQQHPGVVSE